jgi:hypothetical protein
VNATVARGTSGTLVLAEAAGGWSATLNGKPLTPAAAPVDGWAQGFRLPGGGGHLVIARNQTARDLSLGGEAAALLAAFVLALPGSRSSAVAPAARPDAGRTRAGRRRQRPLVAPGDVTIGAARAGGRTRTDVADRPEVAVRAGASAGVSASARAEDDDMRVGVGPVAGAAGSPFGSQRGAGPAGPWQSSGADPGYGTAAGFPSYPGREAPAGPSGAPATGPQPALATGPQPALATGPQPALGGTPPPEPTPPPWAGLDLNAPRTPDASRAHDASRAPDATRTYDAPRMPEAPEAPEGSRAPWPDQAEPLGTARPADPAPAAPRRGRGGQHAARHGKPSRRSRGGDS